MSTVTAHPTPNPDSLKFTRDGSPPFADGLRAYRTLEEAQGDPLGTALLAVPGVANVLIVPAFVTVTKHPAAQWDQLVPSIERILSGADRITG